GTVAAAIAWFEANPPPGMTIGMRGNGNDEQDLGFQAGSMFHDQPWVQITVVPAGDGVAIRVDAMAVWAPTKPAWAYLKAVDAVDATVLRPAFGPSGTPPLAPTAQRTLTGAPAQHLADAIDALPVMTPGVRSCPADRGFSDHLTFHTQDGRTVEAGVS